MLHIALVVQGSINPKIVNFREVKMPAFPERLDRLAQYGCSPCISLSLVGQAVFASDVRVACGNTEVGGSGARESQPAANRKVKTEILYPVQT